MKWFDLEQNKNHGEWVVKIQDVKRNDIDHIYRHDLVNGSFIFANPHTGKVEISLRSTAVKDFGPHRAWWTLREEIGVEPYHNLASVDDWLEAVLDADNPYSAGSNQKHDDDYPAVGSISW